MSAHDTVPAAQVVPLGRDGLTVVEKPRRSKRALLLSSALRVTVKPALSVWAHAPGAPWPTGLLERAAAFLPSPRHTTVEDVRLTRCDAELIRADGAEDDEHAILYLHGGAFLVGGLNTHRGLAARLAATSGGAVLNVGYRMMPKHPVSHAVEDGLAGYTWLLDQGYAPERIVIAGDSAGGYLAFAVALAILESGLESPAGLVAMSPVTDLDPERTLDQPGRPSCALFSQSTWRGFLRLVDMVENALVSDLLKPASSLVDADLRGLPRTLIQVGSDELVLPDAQLMAIRLADSDVEVELQLWEEQVHVFQVAVGLVPEARDATREVGRFVRSACRQAEAATTPGRPSARRSGGTAAGRAAAERQPSGA
ncbi:alpha/beta hydrolase [Mumia sp. zg.B21]|uniref:alpha/beta hydrolase n=1 Tax=Mumia sp. zg.B21 TaxID=2855447 RepID=UPI001C6E05AF|nr:alpha/beta hydrolase [Mumia sp. zg.B21]MBW9210404.1 alpha/beta hydrolase [Mumia sp. zg.B21]